MKLLTPLGLTALSGIIVLIIIYLIKPSYQSKLLPSTYIWQESLKYKKADRPTSKLRNILIIICQILIIALLSLAMATPLVQAKNAFGGRQEVIILDGSANMQIAADGVSRFDRAKAQIKDFAQKSLNDKNDITIILAGSKPSYIVKNERNPAVIEENLNKSVCSLSEGDIAGAMKLAQEQIDGSRLSEMYLYTATEYQYAGEVELKDVSAEGDWNAAVLDVRSESEENFYSFYVDVAVSGMDKYVNLAVNITDINGKDEDVMIEKRVNCTGNNVSTVELKDLEIYSYDKVKVNITMDDGSVDSFVFDNQFYLFGGKKETINIQYYSSSPNNFFNGALLVLKDRYKNIYDINISNPTSLKDVKNKGFDFYIYEHSMPDNLPKDGIVLLANPDKLPSGLGVTLGGVQEGDFTFKSNTAHPIMKHVNAGDITAVTYKPLKADGYENLMFCGNDCVFSLKDTDTEKIAILTLDLNRSNLAMLMDFPVMMNNMFEYFLPPTIKESVFDVNSRIDVSARGHNVMLVHGENKQDINAKSSIVAEEVGSYAIEQTLLSNKKTVREFFVKVPASQSNVLNVEEELDGLFDIKEPENLQKDLLIYLAGAVLLLLCAERFLHSMENV